MDENGQATGFFETLVLPQVDKAAAEKYKAEVETRTVALGCGTTRRFWLRMKKNKMCVFGSWSIFTYKVGP